MVCAGCERCLIHKRYTVFVERLGAVMTDTFISLIRMAAAGARGEAVQEEAVNWQELISLANEHGVLPLVAWAVKHSPQLKCSNEIREFLESRISNISMSNIIRRQRIMYLINELQKEGIEVKLLKGYAIAQYYAHPDSREAVDTDLWVNEKQEKQMYDFLQKKAFEVYPRSFTSHHGICQHKKYGKIEVHTRLYDEIVEDVWFSGIKKSEYVLDPFIKIQLDDGEFTTLGHTDQAIFLALHMVKHFIESGLSIRMMLDISLYLQCNYPCIDFERFYDIMERMHYAKLVNCIFSLMIQYGGFPEEIYACYVKPQPHLIELLLRDMYQGGYMGRREMDERHIGSMAYNRMLFTKDNTQIAYVVKMLWWKARCGARRMFPDLHRMKRMYPVLRKLPLLVPFTWLYHSCAFMKDKIMSGILMKEIQGSNGLCNDIANKRIQLFRELDML